MSKMPWQEPDWTGRRNQYEANPHVPGTITAAAWDLNRAFGDLFDGIVRALRIDRLLRLLSRLGRG